MSSAPMAAAPSSQLNEQQQQQILQQQQQLLEQQQQIAHLQRLQQERERELVLRAEQQKEEYQKQLQLTQERTRASLAQVSSAQQLATSPSSSLPKSKIYVPTPLVAAAAGKVQHTATELLSFLKPSAAAGAATSSSVPAASAAPPANANGQPPAVAVVVGSDASGTTSPPKAEPGRDTDYENRVTRRKRFLQSLASLGVDNDSPPSPGESPLLALESCSDRLATPSPMSSVGRIDDDALPCERPSSAPEIKARSQFSNRFGVHIPAGFLDLAEDDLDLRPSRASPSASAGVRGSRDGATILSSSIKSPRVRTSLQASMIPHPPATAPAPSLDSPAPPPDSPSPPPRDPSHVIRYCDVESDDESDGESDGESSGPSSVVMEPSAGEVYTIVEEEEEVGSPTAADGVSRRRTTGELSQPDALGDARQRSQLVSQRSLEGARPPDALGLTSQPGHGASGNAHSSAGGPPSSMGAAFSALQSSSTAGPLGVVSSAISALQPSSTGGPLSAVSSALSALQGQTAPRQSAAAPIDTRPNPTGPNDNMVHAPMNNATGRQRSMPGRGYQEAGVNPPMAGQAGYPGSAAGYPAAPAAQGYPPSASQGYPNASQGYPSTSQGYPATSQGYPTVGQGYPAASQGYPAASAAFNPPTSSLPTASQGNVHATQAFPATSQGYSATSQGYPAASQGYPTASQGYPTASQDHQASSQSYPPNQQGHPMAAADGFAAASQPFSGPTAAYPGAAQGYPYPEPSQGYPGQTPHAGSAFGPSAPLNGPTHHQLGNSGQQLQRQQLSHAQQNENMLNRNVQGFQASTAGRPPQPLGPQFAAQQPQQLQLGPYQRAQGVADAAHSMGSPYPAGQAATMAGQALPTYPPVTMAPGMLTQAPQHMMNSAGRPPASSASQGPSISGMLADFSRALGPGLRPPDRPDAEQIMYHQQMAAHHQAQHLRKQRLRQQASSRRR
ncbi:trithorax group protein osa-like, partial [Pollicipes pollicipes]|uniref:trithorax group protein osa-like n=1 Tax=Pollicipes pollicipes TaxID=41117 RepID=UPI001884B068